MDKVEADDFGRWRARVVLSTLPAERTVDEACRELGIGPTQFANLRLQALKAVAEGMAPRACGRPPHKRAEPVDVQALRQRVAELEHDNRVLRARLDLAALPALEVPRSKSRPRKRVAPLRRPRRRTLP